MPDPSGSTSDPRKNSGARFERRRLLALGAVAAAGSCGSRADLGSGAASGGSRRVRWNMASSFGSSLRAMYGAAELLAENVERMSGGSFQIRLFEAGELVPALQILDAVQDGSIDAGQTAGYYYTGKNPALAFDTCVPFGLAPRQQAAWLRHGGGLEALRKRYADFGIINFPAGNTGVQMGGWFRRAVGGAADLAGLKMRIPGLGGKVMDALGVSVQNLAGGDIYPALERGAIDATEWVGPYDDEQLGFHKVASHYYYPGWWEPGPELSFLVGTKAWNDLSAEHQAIFEAATQQAAAHMQTVYDRENPRALERLLQFGTQVVPFEQDLMRAAQEASEDLLSTEAAGDGGYTDLLESWRSFRTETFGWFSRAEQAYARFAFGSPS